MSKPSHQSCLEKGVHDFNNCSMEEIIAFKEKLRVEYNKITEPYRTLMMNIDDKIEQKQKQIYDKCSHDYERFSEYHNDRYYICKICGHEK
uniref:Uncharacterized protein n=1 Tax=viral metagenome TaxID=1070528 RepID=A0A6C0KYZ5_9ZZZZ